MEVIISGASRGLGKAIAKELANEDNNLHLIARNKEDLNKLKNELKSTNNNIYIYPTDLSATNIDEKLDFQFEKKEIVLINNLGIYEMDNPSSIEEKTLENQLNLNLYSAIKLSKLILPYMLEKGLGRIVNIGSVMSKNGSSIASSYSISKHALKGWSDGLREELRAKNILVSSIYPGSINTSSWDGIDANREEMIQTEDIAKIISTILSMGNTTLVEEIVLSPRDFRN